jgi:hypothetical protein
MGKQKILIAFFLIISQINFAQIKKNQPVKIKPPKLISSIGIFKDSVVIKTDQAKAILGTPILVKDDKNNVYKVTYYQFAYTRRAVTEDEKTGKLSPTTSLATDYFTSTPLPEKWVRIIREDLKPGEQLFFCDVIVKDTSGQSFYAPNIKIITQ